MANTSLLSPMSREARRLAALHETGILDSEPCDRFDRICELARRALGVPAASIAFVDHGRVWFKADGAGRRLSIDRRESFAQYALDSDDVFVVEDATRDVRFAHFPDVLGPPHVRFFAAAPISTAPGIRIGVVAIKDTRPRTLDSIGRETLSVMAALVQTQLRLGCVTDWPRHQCAMH